MVLHYLTLSDTQECIISIEDVCKDLPYEIVVVDNGSPNGSGQKLAEYYKEYKRVYVILEKENLGFAKGNNVGYRYAQQELQADFIIMINNDTIITQKDFLQTIEKLYLEHNFYVLGPDIISTKDGSHQNPILDDINSVFKVVKAIVRHFFQVILNVLYLDSIAGTFVKNIKRKLSKKTLVSNSLHPYEIEMKNTELHGSCLIFSPLFIKLFNGLYEETFMYYEESMLYHICSKMNLLSLYSPTLFINHKEDSATDALFTKSKQKRLFIYREGMKSTIVLLKLMLHFEREKDKVLNNDIEEKG